MIILYKRGHLGAGKIVLVVFLGLIFYIGYQGIATYLDMQQDVNGYLDRAEAATTAKSMAEFIGYALDGLENHGISEGNWSWIASDNPNTDMSISVGQLENLRTRLFAIEANETMSSVDYAMSMRETKDSFKKIQIDAYNLYAKKYKGYVYMEWFFSIQALLVLGLILSTAALWDFYLIRPRMVCKIKGHRWEEEIDYGDDGEKKKKIERCWRCNKLKEQEQKKE